jgi:hypothetical protein
MTSYGWGLSGNSDKPQECLEKEEFSMIFREGNILSSMLPMKMKIDVHEGGDSPNLTDP